MDIRIPRRPFSLRSWESPAPFFECLSIYCYEKNFAIIGIRSCWFGEQGY